MKKGAGRLGEAEIRFPLDQEGRIGHEYTNNFDLFVSCQVEQQKHNVFFRAAKTLLFIVFFLCVSFYLLAISLVTIFCLSAAAALQLFSLLRCQKAFSSLTADTPQPHWVAPADICCECSISILAWERVWVYVLLRRISSDLRFISLISCGPGHLCVCKWVDAACLEILELLFGAHTLQLHPESFVVASLGAILLFVCWHAMLVSASVSTLQKLSEYLPS